MKGENFIVKIEKRRKKFGIPYRKTHIIYDLLTNNRMDDILKLSQEVKL